MAEDELLHPLINGEKTPTSTRIPVRILLALLSASIGILSLYLIVLQVGLVNLEPLAGGAILIPLKGDCDFKPNGTCTPSKYESVVSCNGPLSCPSKIVGLLGDGNISVVGVTPSGPTRNDTTIRDVLRDILDLPEYWIAIVVLSVGQIIGWICLAVNRYHQRTIIKRLCCITYGVTRAFTPVALYICYAGILHNVNINLDEPPSFLKIFFTLLPHLSAMISIFDGLSSMLLWH